MEEGKSEVAIEHIGYWIKVIDRNVTNLHNKKLEKYGLTSSQVSALCNLWRKDGVTQKDLAERLQMRPASLSGLVDTLLAKGLVNRVHDEEDGRTKRLYLTEKGKCIKEDILGVFKDLEEILGRGFSEEEKQVILCWLKRINRNLE